MNAFLLLLCPVYVHRIGLLRVALASSIMCVKMARIAHARSTWSEYVGKRKLRYCSGNDGGKDRQHYSPRKLLYFNVYHAARRLNVSCRHVRVVRNVLEAH